MNGLEADLKVTEYLGYVVDICHLGYHLFTPFYLFFARLCKFFFLKTSDGKSFQLCRPNGLSHNYQLCHGSRKAAINNIFMNIFICMNIPVFS